ncbi:MAG: hypothetical protein NVS1B14_12480 [Vulcanimicrobiaceae bacterium]
MRCLPKSEENEQRTRTVSRHHARIDWRGGRAFVTDLDSKTGTTVNDTAVRAEPLELHDGDTLAIGKYVRLNFAHAPASGGELPKWARLVRADEYGGEQVFVLVLTEAKISAGADAAIPIAAQSAGGDVVRLCAVNNDLAVQSIGAPEPMRLRDGETLRVGTVSVSVAIES